MDFITDVDLLETEDVLVSLIVQQSREEDELIARMFQERRARILQLFQAELFLVEEEDDTFNTLLVEYRESSIHHFSTEVLYDIWDASPFIYFSRERRRRKDRMDFTEQYWLQKYPSLQDPTLDNPNPPFAFRDHYRINRSTFDKIVNICMRSSHYAGSILRGGVPVEEIQVATVLWRFSNCHYGYRIAEMTLGPSAGSYSNFTKRFLATMMAYSKNVISWLISDPVRAAEIVCGFKGRDTVRLDETLGAIDGKNVVIQKPKNRGNDYVDRKGRASVNMMAVCNHLGRFMFIKLGISGTRIYIECVKHFLTIRFLLCSMKNT